MVAPGLGELARPKAVLEQKSQDQPVPQCMPPGPGHPV